jgi:hypothetical protein
MCDRKFNIWVLVRRKIMKWQFCISLVSFPLTYPLLLASYYVGKNLREVNIVEVIKRNKEVF